MQHWNGTPYALRPIDLDVLEEQDGAGAGYCLVCGSLLPRGMRRIYCLEHSAYPQELIQRERRRQLRRREPAA